MADQPRRTRPLTRVQAAQNRAFVKLLRRTGNVRLACRELGLAYGTMQHRRRHHAHFAAAWASALVLAAASLAKRDERGKKGRHGRFAPTMLSHCCHSPRDVDRARSATRRPVLNVSSTEARLCSAKAPFRSAFRTIGGEPHLVRLKSGALQVRRAQPGKLTAAAEQAFLAALSATCNVRLAAAAVGAAAGAFHRRKRKDPAFAREHRLAVERGYQALELALLESGAPASHEHDDWRCNDPPAIPPLTANQALQLLYLRQKEVRLQAEPDFVRRRPGESPEAQSVRLAAIYEERRKRAREAFEVAEAERMDRGEPAWGPAGEAVRAELERGSALPDLAQVTGWSAADPARAPHDPRRALFGGWRLAQMAAKLGRAGQVTRSESA